MNKRDAANYLGISTRALEGHASKGELSVRYVKGRTGDVADYDESELRKLKAKLDSKRAARPAVTDNSPETREGEPRSLARLSDVQSGDLFQALLALAQKRKTQPQVSPSEKLMVTLKEAAEIVSLSPAHLREAINAKKLKGRIIGRGYKIKRVDLDAYIKKL
jgi:excisionase family DNA binding protein